MQQKDYIHYVPPMVVEENFEEIWKLKYHLIKSYDELLDFFHTKFVSNSFFAWDTETSDLNPEKGSKTGDLVEGRIVGYSFTQDGHNGYYVPLTHPDYAIGYKALKVLYAMICKSKLNLLYNCRFDIRFLEHMTPEKYDYIPEFDEVIYKFDCSRIPYFDVQNSVWLSDTNVSMPSLKKSEKHFLGWNPPTFDDTTGGEANFGYLPAERGYRYACIDALATYNLFFKTEKYYVESGAAGKLDNEALYPLMKFEDTPIYVDHDYLLSMKTDILNKLEDLKSYLYKEAGCVYNINSGRELVKVFLQLGIDTGKRTKTGQMETNIKAINSYLSSHPNNEYLQNLIDYKKLLKFYNSYLEKLIDISDPDNVKKHPIRFCYFTQRVPSGRLACGTDGKNTYFSSINFQSLPKPHSHNYHCRKATTDEIEKKLDLAGWVFGDDFEGPLTEGQDPHLNVRKAFHAPPQDPDAVIVSVDMKAEELRTVANIYNEKTWIHAFNSGQDVHKSCYSDDTEFLTIDGWKTYNEINEDTLIAQYDKGKISYTKAGPVYYGSTGELYHFKTKYNDLLVTGNHRMLYKSSYRKHEKIKIAESLSCGEFRNAANYECDDAFPLLTDTTIKSLGFYFGDISYHRNTSLKKHLSDKPFCKLVKDNCREGIPELIYKLSFRQRRLFIDSFLKSCSTKVKRKGSVCYTSYFSNKNLLDDFQRLCAISDYSTYIDYKHFNTSGIHILYIHTNVWHSFNKTNITKEHYNGKTVCYSVPSGILIVRRNGKVSICGNTACKIFGEENYCKEARKKAKIASFGILYGSSAYGFHNSFPDMTIDECIEFIDKFKKALPSIESGQQSSIRKAKKQGYVKTSFGRPRRVKYFLGHPDRKIRSFGERTVMNTEVQGTAADVLKLILVRLWKNLFTKYPRVKWIGTIHDEVNYLVPRDLLHEVVPIIIKCQTVKLPNWQVTLECDLSMGKSFGDLIPFEYNESTGEFTPQFEEDKKEEPIVKENIIEFDETDVDDYNYLQ